MGKESWTSLRGVFHWPLSTFAFSSSIVVHMFDPDAHLPRINKGMVYLGACLIAGIRLAREKQVNMRVIPTRTAVEESIDMAKEIYSQVFRKAPEQMKDKC